MIVKQLPAFHWSVCSFNILQSSKGQTKWLASNSQLFNWSVCTPVLHFGLLQHSALNSFPNNCPSAFSHAHCPYGNQGIFKNSIPHYRFLRQLCSEWGQKCPLVRKSWLNGILPSSPSTLDFKESRCSRIPSDVEKNIESKIFLIFHTLHICTYICTMYIYVV